MDFTVLILGFFFGGILAYSRLNKFDTISGAARLTDLTVPKVIAMAVGLGMIFLTIVIAMGLAQYHVKPFVVGGVIIGGLIFGAGMAILGYCPGTLAISVGEGALDAMVGVIGGLAGGIVYTLVLPFISGLLGPDLGKISLYSLTGGQGFLFGFFVVFIGALFIAASLWLNKIDKTKDIKWLYSGIGLAVLNSIVFLTAVADRPIGASTSFPYVGDLLAGFTDNNYFEKITKSGHWELIFLTGSLLAGFAFALARKEFKFQMMHRTWKEFRGDSVTERIVWAFVGGFILIFGARMAGGCTSGHIISGGMQIAVSSLVFAVFVFAGLLITGKIFYKKR